MGKRLKLLIHNREYLNSQIALKKELNTISFGKWNMQIKAPMKYNCIPTRKTKI